MTLMQTLRTQFFMTIVSSIVTLQLINISIDPADPHHGPEDLTINEVESCVELILEEVLDRTDAIGEVDDQDEDSGRPINSFTLFAVENSWTITDKEFTVTQQKNFQYTELFVPNFSPSILCPPPKSA